MSDTPESVIALTRELEMRLAASRDMVAVRDAEIAALKEQIEKALELTVGDYGLLSERIQEVLAPGEQR